MQRKTYDALGLAFAAPAMSIRARRRALPASILATPFATGPADWIARMGRFATPPGLQGVLLDPPSVAVDLAHPGPTPVPVTPVVRCHHP